jgi:hypothetical protein
LNILSLLAVVAVQLFTLVVRAAAVQEDTDAQSLANLRAVVRQLKAN